MGLGGNPRAGKSTDRSLTLPAAAEKMAAVPGPFPLAAIFDLSHPARYVHWHFFQMSVANIVVILLMIAVFVAALLLPFPGRSRRS